MWFWDRLTKRKKQEELEKRQVSKAPHLARPENVQAVSSDNAGDKASVGAQGAAARTPSSVLSATAAGALHIIAYPHSTEKTAAALPHGTYTFVVNPKASKGQVRQALKDLYGVTAVSVRMVRLPGKAVRFGRLSGTRSVRAHAMVTLKKGETLSLPVQGT